MRVHFKFQECVHPTPGAPPPQGIVGLACPPAQGEAGPPPQGIVGEAGPPPPGGPPPHRPCDFDLPFLLMHMRCTFQMGWRGCHHYCHWLGTGGCVNVPDVGRRAQFPSQWRHKTST